MQGKSDPNPELLDAAALCRQLVRDGSVEAFLADHRHELFPDDLFRAAVAGFHHPARCRRPVGATRSGPFGEWKVVEPTNQTCSR